MSFSTTASVVVGSTPPALVGKAMLLPSISTAELVVMLENVSLTRYDSVESCANGSPPRATVPL